MKAKTFKNIPFKLTLPIISISQGQINVKFGFKTPDVLEHAIMLYECCLSDKMNHEYVCRYKNLLKKGSAYDKTISLDVPIHNTDFLKTGSYLWLRFVAEDSAHFEVCYHTVSSANPPQLEYVEKTEWPLSQVKELVEAKTIDSPASKTKEDSEDTKPVSGLGPAAGHMNVLPITLYKNKLLQEKYFLQKEGGAKHKLSNGIRISHHPGLCTYSFEMEAELHLTDDAPVRLFVGANSASGSVLVCEGFRLVLVVNADFGERISQAYVSVEPWKLLEALVNKLNLLNTGHRLALKLINEGPYLATKENADQIPKGQEVALKAAEENDITVIWGPPGTGKTYTMAQIAKKGLLEGKSILVVSHSNISVDGIVKQTARILREDGLDSYLKKGKVLRYGYVRDDELSDDDDAVAYNYVLQRIPTLRNQLYEALKQKAFLQKSGKINTPEGVLVENELKEIRAKIKVFEKDYAEKAQFLATTISKVTIDSIFDNKKFDIVMFDEISMAYIPQIICAAMYAKQKLVLVGDFKQLSPIAQSPAKDKLSEDIFSYLRISDGDEIHAHPWLVMLHEQRRMHPAISGFVNRYIYKRLLRDHESVQYSKDFIVNREPFSGSAANLLNLSGTYSAAMKNSDNSRFNILSAIIAFLTAIEAEQAGEDNIGIITPYAAQTRLIRAMIQDYNTTVNRETSVSCATVHQFQGSERNVIIFDVVENYPFSKVGWLMGKEIDSVNRLINVAVTRARGKLIVLADARFWKNKFSIIDHIVYLLIRYLQKYQHECSIQEENLQPYLDTLPWSSILRHYEKKVDLFAAFQKDIESAMHKIVISIPDGNLDHPEQKEVLDWILSAMKKGVRILCKSNGYADLPEQWKSITWGTENAVFPLIVLDDKVAWYGLPYAKGTFKEGTAEFYTAYKAVYRISGEHTIEMIKGFSDLEFRQVKGTLTALMEKNQPIAVGGEDGKDSSGLDAFVQSKKKCPVCKSPMRLTKGKSGKTYLKCSSSTCKETGLLTPDLINWYISSENITCPEHHCGLHAGLSKYGIYVRCEMGHFLKPEQI